MMRASTRSFMSNKCVTPEVSVYVPWKLFLIACALIVARVEGHSATINWYDPKPNYSIARNWDERALESIRMDTPHPPVQARNLFSYAVCMYDAWAAYDTNAVGFIYHKKHTAGVPTVGHPASRR